MSDNFFPSKLFQEKPEEKTMIKDLKDLHLNDAINSNRDQISSFQNDHQQQQQQQELMICESKNVIDNNNNEYIETNELNQQILEQISNASSPSTARFINNQFRFGPGGDPGPEKFRESLEEYVDDNITNKINFDVEHDYYDNDIDSLESYFEEDYFDEIYF